MHVPISAMRALVRLHKGGALCVRARCDNRAQSDLLVFIYLDGKNLLRATFRSHTILTCVDVEPSKLIFARARHAGNQAHRPQEQGTQ